MSLHLRRIAAIAGTVALMGLGGTGTGTAQAQQQVELISGPFGTGSYVLSTALEQIVNGEDDGLSLTASETPGLTFNARSLIKDPGRQVNTIMSFTSGINYLAVEGLAPFPEALPSAKLIANYNLGAVWLATFDPDIKTLEDLKGKRVALGTPPQILWTIEPLAIIRDGWGMEGDLKIETIGTKEAAQALLNGTVDVAIIGGYANPETGQFLPSPQTVELQASGRTLYHISWGPDAVAKARDASGMPLISAKVPAGAVEGLETELDTFYDAIGWQAYPDLDEETAYKVTKAIIANVGKFSEYHALGKLMSPSALLYGWDAEDIHPGALRAYREAGLIK
ncbi:TAXI family TRAP transporter solute-binding subunit [Alloyangia pacifica]|uniref:TAXI family TRAP transporter solute-binding subunit n=1 Tax=Alloyangia pacifica TaxID=311180 RepID=A0A1I6UW81_9RHOB|nr:TAXI family TRAP transporter solute-binding subunit [Alloyangia pacifica]SDI28022.1 hypothetical protein SAMN04488245_1147 [Alloyangia pacifica]SFT05676.1 hypothetical protein SAMN04488050_10956 [Alloyangia pacifica]